MSLADQLESLLPPGRHLSFGELTLCRHEDGTFEARHSVPDAAEAALAEIHSVRDLRELAKYDAAGNYRPLKTAPGLVAGWRTETRSPSEFLKRLDAIYPALFATWIAFQRGQITAVPLRRTLNRQTGMYRLVGTITSEMAERIRRELCQPGCLRQITWPNEENDPPANQIEPADRIPLLCSEACTFAVNRARELAKTVPKTRIDPPGPDGD